MKALRDMKMMLMDKMDTMKVRISESIVNDVVIFVQMVSTWCTSSIRLILVVFVYCLYRDCYAFVDRFLNDIEFNNIYITRYFEHLDERRRIDESITRSLLPLTRFEIKFDLYHLTTNKHNIRFV